MLYITTRFLRMFKYYQLVRQDAHSLIQTYLILSCSVVSLKIYFLKVYSKIINTILPFLIVNQNSVSFYV